MREEFILLKKIEAVVLDYLKLKEEHLYKDKYEIKVDNSKIPTAIHALIILAARTLSGSYMNSHEWEWKDGRSRALDCLAEELDKQREELRREVK